MKGRKQLSSRFQRRPSPLAKRNPNSASPTSASIRHRVPGEQEFRPLPLGRPPSRRSKSAVAHQSSKADEGLRHILASHTFNGVATDGLDGANPFERGRPSARQSRRRPAPHPPLPYF